MNVEKKKILVVEAASNGKNYVLEAAARGLHPVLLYPKLGSETAAYGKMRINDAKQMSKYTDDVIFAQNDDLEELFEQMKSFSPAAVVAGSEVGVFISDYLAERFGLPGNSSATSPLRREKFKMQEALRRAGVPALRSKSVSSERECSEFVRELGSFPIVVKPLSGAATVGVHFCGNEKEVLHAFNMVRSERDIFGGDNSVVLLQEFAKGTEYIVNTVSCGGRHALTDVWQYSKVAIGSEGNAYDCARLVREPSPEHLEMIGYVKKSLTALGFQYGPAHSEVMLTHKGPRLIETGARPMGGFFPAEILTESLGHKIVDIALDSYIDEGKFDEFSKRPYAPKRSVLVKYFIAPEAKEFASMPLLKLIQFLPSARSGSFLDVMDDFSTARTVDLTTGAGEVILCHESEDTLMRDYGILRAFETECFDLLYSSSHIEVGPCKVVLNGRDMNLFEGGKRDFEDLIDSLGELSKGAAAGGKLEIPGDLQPSVRAWELLLKAFGWAKSSDGSFLKI